MDAKTVKGACIAAVTLGGLLLAYSLSHGRPVRVTVAALTNDGAAYDGRLVTLTAWMVDQGQLNGVPHWVMCDLNPHDYIIGTPTRYIFVRPWSEKCQAFTKVEISGRFVAQSYVVNATSFMPTGVGPITPVGALATHEGERNWAAAVGRTYTADTGPWLNEPYNRGRAIYVAEVGGSDAVFAYLGATTPYKSDSVSRPFASK